ncbi:hypothetical protein WG922_16020 [Ramlibacter sp. AN1015]|uniref:hypothetical protein n=1 Tax=Ramlibacter sp. AN1015 TaxID=3133428 RepID=UPI0030C1D5D9
MTSKTEFDCCGNGFGAHRCRVKGGQVCDTGRDRTGPPGEIVVSDVVAPVLPKARADQGFLGREAPKKALDARRL